MFLSLFDFNTKMSEKQVKNRLFTYNHVHFCHHTRVALTFVLTIQYSSKSGGGNIRPAGHIRPSKTKFLAIY